MEGFSPETSFRGASAASYDDEARGDEDAAAAFLAARAPGGTALEFAIGTGRIAVPLVERGVRVDGIELSGDMVEQLRAKPASADLDVVVGDMSTASTGRTYDLVYLVFNTIFNLLTQDDQVRCFENAARHLTADGCFVVEAGVPSSWLPQRSYVDAERVAADGVTLDVCRYDPATQILDENHVRITAGAIRFGPISQRLAWPAELDLMARIAGLRLRERWGGWDGQPYTGEGLHVSVYERA
jgi:SAM-dependent methyltransferase